MRLALFMLVLLGLMWTALIWASLAGDRKATHQPHPTKFAVNGDGEPQVAILVGEVSAQNDRRLAAPGFLFGATMIILLTVCILLSTEDAAHRNLLQTLIVSGGAIFLAAFAYMFWTWVAAAKDELLGPFPKATTLMLLGMTIAPALFGVIYVIGFPYWFDAGVRQRSAGRQRRSAGR